MLGLFSDSDQNKIQMSPPRHRTWDLDHWFWGSTRTVRRTPISQAMIGTTATTIVYSRALTYPEGYSSGLATCPFCAISPHRHRGSYRRRNQGARPERPRADDG